MIKNQRQYEVTRAQAEKFAAALQALEKSAHRKATMHPRLLRAQKDAIRSQLDELREQIEDYEQLQRLKPDLEALQSIDVVPMTLIQSRIAAGLTHKQLANLVGVKEQQIQRYEESEYESASLERLRQVAAALRYAAAAPPKKKSLAPRKAK